MSSTDDASTTSATRQWVVTLQPSEDKPTKQPTNWSRVGRITLFVSFIGLIAVVILAGAFTVTWRTTFPAKGVTGASGSSGASGASGSSGGSGSSGSTGDVIFTTGYTGPNGVQFPTGAQGNRGITGATGTTGMPFTINNAGILDEMVVATIEQSTSIYWYVVTGDLRASFASPAGLPVSMTNHLIQWNPFLQQWHDNGPWLGQTGDTGFGYVTGPQGPTGPQTFVSPGSTGPNGPTGFGFNGTGPVDLGYLFGPGSDGDFGASGTPYTLTMTRDMFFQNLTVGPSSTINTQGYRIFVSQILTLDGTIQCNGSNGANAGFSTGAGAHVGYAIRGGAGGGGYDPNATLLGIGGAGATGYAFGFNPTRADTPFGRGSLFTQSNNVNAIYTGMGQVQSTSLLYGGGSALTQFPQGFPSGGSEGATVNVLGQEDSLLFLTAILMPVQFPPVYAAPIPMSGGAGGGAGRSGNFRLTAASGGGGGGIVAILAANIRGTSIPATGSIQAKGGNAGANASGQDSSGAGGGGGTVIVRTTTPYSNWGIAGIDVSGGAPNNLNYGPGSPVNQAIAYGLPGQIFILQ